MLSHMWLPVIVIGMGGTASLIRIMRGTMLDELRKPYVMTARAKGVRENRLLLKYPVRIAINPLISTLGWLLPSLISGSAITSIVLNLPTTGPILLRALLAQDMYLAGSFMLILSVLTMVGTLISDLLLAGIDPRIRYGGISE
jgi:peptide/nickel transport system permease protein